MPQMPVRALGWVLMVGCCLRAVGPLLGAETIWEVSAYRVQLVAAVEPSPAWPEDMADRLTQHLIEQCHNYIGPLWEVRAGKAPPTLRRKMLADLESLRPEDLPTGWQEADKWFFLVVRAVGQGYQVQVREWDVRTELFGPSVSAEVVQSAKLGRVAMDTILGAFCPLARIDRPKQGQTLLRPRGMALPKTPGAPLWIKPGMVFRPVLRKNDRQGNPLTIKPIDWTYLVVQRVEPQGLDCRVYSGLGGALAERRRGRIEMLALAIKPLHRPCLLLLADRQEPTSPLVGYEVFAYRPGESDVRSLGRTDLRGQLLLPPTGEGLLMLLIASGGTPVARLPVVPGLQERLQVLLPKDSPRLAAEGFVRGFQETLLDLVAQREILLARIQRRLEKGQTEEAAQLLDELEALRRQRDGLALQLAEQEKTLTSADPELRPKIEALWAEARQLLAQHADDRILRELASQLIQAKQQPPATPATETKP